MIHTSFRTIFSMRTPSGNVVSNHVSSTDSPSALDEKLGQVHEYTRAREIAEITFIDSTPKLNHALIVSNKNVYDIVHDFGYPKLESEDEVIIQNYATGLNSIDWKSVDFNFCLPEFPWITGREMAGVVEAVGSNVENFTMGDRVWTSTYYKDRRAGCFQKYVTVPQHTICHIPKNLDFEKAACLGVAGLTAAMTLWMWLEVPLRPDLEIITNRGPDIMLIWGGSTVTAQFAIQIAARSGLGVIAVSSEKNKDLVLQLGAMHVVTRDRKSNDQVVSEIRSLGGDCITRAVDLVGPDTAEYCLKALSTTRPSIFAPLAMISSKSIVPDNITVQTVEMKQFTLDPQCRVYATELNRLVSDGLIVLPNIEVLNGGLTSVVSGLKRLKDGDMAGSKLVVRMV